MRARTHPTQSAAVLNEIAGHVLAGLICFAALTVLALSVNHAGSLDIVLQRPGLAATLWLGALFAFAPLIICVAVGSVRRGEQSPAWPHLEDD
jgi:hypothetical protein